MSEPGRPPFATGGRGNPIDDRLAVQTARATEHRRRPRSSRRRPAKGSRLAALALSLFTTFGLGAYLAQGNRSSSSAIPLATAPTTSASAPTTTTSPSDGSASGSSSSGSSNGGGASSTGLQDGTFTGSAASNKYGNVQVQVVDANGKITQVEIVQYPDRDRKSVEINNEAIPALISETLSAQTASVDNVSGATYTSTSYEESLQSAIDQAHSGTSST